MDLQIVKSLVVIFLTITAVLVVLRQCRKPAWGIGRLFLWNMNARHARVTNWGLTHVRIDKGFTILDVGCGGGRTVQTLATLASAGRVYGIDYSDESVATARRTNARWIEAGRVEIRQGSVSSLPFPEATFDLVSAVETHYYWPDPAGDFREILRVLKPGGTMVLIAETYRGMRFNLPYQLAMKLLRARYLTLADHHELLSSAGYSDVAISEESTKGWMCAVGRRPMERDLPSSRSAPLPR